MLPFRHPLSIRIRIRIPHLRFKRIRIQIIRISRHPNPSLLQPKGVGTHHPQPMKMDFLPSELSKTGQIT
jgi:hypothetical protein